jgi:hypothetical protein
MSGDAASQVGLWWTLFTTLGGTVVGSVVSVTTSYVLQTKSLKATKDLHDRDRTEIRKAL